MSRLSIVLAAVLLVGACAAPPEPSASATSASATPTPPPAATAARRVCPAATFDPAVPPFDEPFFAGDESAALALALVNTLAVIYRDPGAVDLCGTFTDRGLATALKTDPRLAAVLEHGARIEQRHVFRLRYEASYDLRERPPRIQMDIVYDVPAGATTIEASGATSRSDAAERVGHHVTLVFDGHRWRVDDFGPITGANHELTALPSVPPPGPPCPAIVRDPPGAPFDEDELRRWCDDQRRVVRRPDQLVLFTRYPCGVGSAAILSIGRPLGTGLDRLIRWEYVRDPADEFLAQGWVTEPYQGDATLPDDAVATGWTNGNIDLWISASELDRAIYVVRGETVERWSRAVDGWGVIDCN